MRDEASPPLDVPRRPVEQDEAPRAMDRASEEDAEDARRHGEMDEALRGVPGVSLMDRQNAALGDRLVIRGAGARSQFGVRGVAVLMDGVPLTLPDGQTMLDAVDPGMLGDVEVLRGAASGLYGNAAGGVLLLETRPPGDDPLRVEPRVRLDGLGGWASRLAAHGTLGEQGYRVEGSWTQSPGYRDHSDRRIGRLGVQTRHPVGDDGSVRVDVAASTMPEAENPGSLPAELARDDPTAAWETNVDQGTAEAVHQGRLGVTVEHDVAEDAAVDATAWALLRSADAVIPFRIIDLDRRAAGLRFAARGRVDAGDVPLRWLAGLDLALQDDRRRELENLGVPPDGDEARRGALLLDQVERVVTGAPFARLEAVLSAGLHLEAGLRADVHGFTADDRLLSDGDDSGTRVMWAPSPSAGVRWEATSWLDLWAHHATAFQTPTTSELSNRPNDQGGLDPDLDPALTRDLEGGARVRVDGLSVEVVGWAAWVRDALVPTEDEEGQVFFRNAGRVLRRGIETRVSWEPSERWGLLVTHAFSRHTFREFTTPDGDFEGHRVPGVPDHVLHGAVSWRPLGGLRLRVDAEWVDAYPVDDANTASNPAHTVIDAHAAWEISLGAGRTLTPFVAAENLLDERYSASVVPNAFGDRYFEPAPGLTVSGGVQGSF
ncbi:MAG: TonB-dependent receptor [Myxococcota bacterium]